MNTMEKKNMSNVTSISAPRNFVITSERDPATLTPEWGIKPDHAKPFAYGARAIFVRRKGEQLLDFPYDRRQMVGGTQAEREAFSAWINKVGMPRIEKLILDSDVRPSDAVQVVDYLDGVEITFSPKKSCGYLYIGIWPSEGWIEASKDMKPAGTLIPRKGPGLAKAGSGIVEEKLPRRKKPKSDLPKGSMYAVVIAPGKKPVIEIVKSTLEAQQSIVGGFIQHVPLRGRKYTVVVNEEGLMMGLPHNRTVMYDPKAGRLHGVHELHGTILCIQHTGMTKATAEAIVEEWSK